MRGLKRLCQHCNTKFAPRRSDALFCSATCKQARHRMREGERRESAAMVFKQRRKQEALEVIDCLDGYRSVAAVCHQEAENSGLGLRFMATRIGVLAVETVPGALEAAKNPLYGREVKTRSDDPQIATLLSLHTLGGSYISQVADRECRKALEKGPTDVVLYIHDFDYWLAELRKKPIQHLPTSSWETVWPRSDDLDDGEYDAGPDDRDLRANDFALCDGFQIIDSRKQ